MMPLNDKTLFTEKITAIKSKDGTFYWIIAHEFGNWQFYIFKLTSTGIEGNRPFKTIGAGSSHQDIESGDEVHRGATGYLKASPKGDFIAVAVESLKSFELFKFNNETGDITFIGNLPAGSSEKPKDTTWNAYGVEFSPTGNFLYGSARKGGVIYQWDISDLDIDKIRNSVAIIRPENTLVLCGAMQLAFNGKIYVALGGKPYLGVISSPIQKNCNYIELGASLIDNETGKGGTAMYGLPTFLPDFFQATHFGFENDCYKDSTLFYLSTRIGIADPPVWNVWDSANVFLGPVEVDKETWQGVYVFPEPGNYVVEMRATQFGSLILEKRTITIQSLPDLNFEDQTYMCQGSSATLDAGYGAFYYWPHNTNLSLERYVSVNQPGTYSVTVTHYNGCVNSDTTEVVEKPLPVIDSIVVNKAACGYDTGSIELVMETDTSDYYFYWANYPDVHTNKLIGLGGNIYEVTVSSKTTGCSITNKITVSEEDAPDVTISSSVSKPVCPGTPVTLTASGAVNWLWENPEGETSSSIVVKPLETTTYIVKGYSVDDITHDTCSGFKTIEVVVFKVPPPDLGSDRWEGCQGDSIILDGGAYESWNWSNGEISRKIVVKDSINPLILRVTDQNGCQSEDTTSIIIKPLPIVDLGADRIVCKGTIVTLDGGEGDTWNWLPGGETTQNIDVTSSGKYEVTTTKLGCSVTRGVSIKVNSPDNLKITDVLVKDITCSGYADGSIQIAAHGDGSMYEYSIDDGATYHDNQGLFENLDGSTPYYIRVKEDGVCDVKSDSVYEIHEPDSISVDYKLVSPSCEQCEDGEITLTVTGGTPPYSVLWSTLDSTLHLRNIGMGTFTVWVTDALQCPSKTRIQMEKGQDTYSIPNAFSPNDDRVNDLWEIAALKDKPNCVVQVFDRSGRKIFESEPGYPESDYWDGTDDTTGQPVPVGSYFYLIYVDKTTKAKPLTGTVTLLR